MHIFELPIVQLSTSLGAAFEVMQQRNRSAVIADRKPEFLLLMAVDIVRGISKWISSIAVLIEDPDLEKRSLYIPSLMTLTSKTVSLVDPFATAAPYREILNEAGQDFGLLAVSPNYAFIFTHSEAQAVDLEPSPKSCYCTATPACNGLGNKTGSDCSKGHTSTIYCV
jgi:hypothetical protein